MTLGKQSAPSLSHSESKEAARRAGVCAALLTDPRDGPQHGPKGKRGSFALQWLEVSFLRCLVHQTNLVKLSKEEQGPMDLDQVETDLGDWEELEHPTLGIPYYYNHVCANSVAVRGVMTAVIAENRRNTMGAPSCRGAV